MKRLFLLLLVCFVTISTPGQENSFANASDSVVQIVISTPDGKMTAGTGFFVEDDIIVSAGHVYWQVGQSVTEDKGIRIFARKTSRTSGRFMIPLILINTDRKHDLVCFRLIPESFKESWPGFVVKPLMLSKQSPQLGDDVFLEGFIGVDEFPLLSRGVVAGQPTSSDDMLLDITANQGQSGAPIISMKTGEVVGVLTGTVPTVFPGSTQPSSAGLSRATRSEYVRALLNSLPSPKPGAAH